MGAPGAAAKAGGKADTKLEQRSTREATAIEKARRTPTPTPTLALLRTRSPQPHPRTRTPQPHPRPHPRPRPSPHSPSPVPNPPPDREPHPEQAQLAEGEEILVKCNGLCDRDGPVLSELYDASGEAGRARLVGLG